MNKFKATRRNDQPERDGEGMVEVVAIALGWFAPNPNEMENKKQDSSIKICKHND